MKITHIIYSLTILVSLSSCNSNESKNTNESNKTDNKTIESEEKNTTDSKFVGLWKFLSRNPKSEIDLLPFMAPIEKVKNTNEAYTFGIAEQFFMFTKKDENTLIGETKNFELKFNEQNQHLYFNNGEAILEFSKVK